MLRHWPNSQSCLLCLFVCLFLAQQPTVGHGLLIHEVFRSHTTTHHSWEHSSGRVIGSLHRPLPDNIQHSQHTNIRAPGGIRTHDLSRRAAEDLRLRSRGHRDRHAYYVAIAIGLQKAEQGERPEFLLNNCTSNTTMLQPQQYLSNSLCHKHHC